MNEIFVLDACALIALTNQEEGSDIVSEVFVKANLGRAQLYMNRVNLCEVYYGFYREHGKDYALSVLKDVERSPVLISEFDRAVMLEAGRLKASYKISFADSAALAQALVLNGQLITSDHHEFDKIDGVEPIRFLWIR